MKKVVTMIMMLALAVSLLSGCFRIPKNVIQAIQSSKPSASASSSDAEESSKPDTQNSPDTHTDSEASSAPADLTKAKNPSEGYSNYSTLKSDAMDRITAASEKSDELSMAVSMSMLGVAMADLSLIPLTVLTDDPQAASMALGMLGMSDVKIDGKGSDFTITYKDSEGGVNKQTCKYDVSKDQLTTTLFDPSGKVTLLFEYVNLGDGYVSQYYYPSDDGYEIIKCFFDKDNTAAFGTTTIKDEPASIIGKSSFKEDFVKNDESYLILKDGKLTVLDNGTTTTN